jgi:lysophospholipase L1-like esterase
MLRLVFCILLLSCSKAEMSGSSTVTTLSGNGPVRTWLALGDSYTIGQSVSESERFPAQTANLLKLSGINISDPDYIAATGWTTNSLSNAILSRNPVPHDVVSLLIGVNDQYQTHDTSGYRQRFTSLLVKAIELAQGKNEKVFVLSIPDYSVTPFALGYDTARIRMEIDWFNNINKSVTTLFNCNYLDITASTRDGRNDPTLIAGDGLHPSGKEYKRWADKLAPMMLLQLK